MDFDVNSIDIIGERNDGGIDLYIVFSEKLDDSTEKQTLLLDKIENYLMYLKSDDFLRDFPHVHTNSKCIKLKITQKPSAMVTNWFMEIENWVSSYGVKFEVVCLE